MQGRLVKDVEPHLFQPGDYGLWHGTWYALCPNGALANLGAHTVVENSDNTITVTPSILCTDWQKGEYHGYITNGEWRAC